MKNRFTRLICLAIALILLTFGGAASAEYYWDSPVVLSAETEEAVAEKVAELAAECAASGAKGDYEVALWMHDWLIYNADYDDSLTERGADGVLLKGTGVCQSYTLAYGLLLDAMGIEHQQVISSAMNHMWSLVKMEGEWYHVDCTWDDPTGGGYENHAYFGLSDALMSRDHTWDNADTLDPCTATACNYYIRSGECTVVSSQEELNATLLAQMAAGNGSISFYNISTDGFSLADGLEEWLEAESWKYSFTGYTYDTDPYYSTLTLEGYDPSLISVEYTGGTSLKANLAAALSAKPSTIRVYNHSGETLDASALFDKAYAELIALAADYSCIPPVSYGYSDEFVSIELTYVTENTLPEPCESNGSVNAELSVTLSSGGTVSASDYSGQRVIWVIGTSYDGYTALMMNNLQASASILSKANVPVVVGLWDYDSSDTVDDFSATYSRFAVGNPDMDAVMYALIDFGFDSYSAPIVFIQDTDGKLIFCAARHMDEPLSAVAAAVEGQLPVVYENVLTLPAGLTAVEEAAFKGSTAFEEVRFEGDLVTSIGAEAFKDCTALKAITIPDSVTSIGENAFDGCEELTIYAASGSAAQVYAAENDIAWKPVD